MAGGGYWPKSNAASAVANKWALIADSRFFFLNVAVNSFSLAGAVQGATRGFGDCVVRRPQGDPFACVLNWSASSSIASMIDAQFENGTDQRHSMPRGYSGLGSSVAHYCLPYTGTTSSYSGSDALMGAFPSPVDGELKLSKRYFNTVPTGVSGAVRCDLPGMYSVPQSAAGDSFKLWDVAAGAGALAGRNLMALNPANTTMSASVAGSANCGVSFVDITGPWR
jgi:hypothetical protein